MRHRIVPALPLLGAVPMCGVLGDTEQATAFDDMVNWEQNGVKPAGDEVLDAATVANANYGCKFTNNTLVSGEENPTTAALRASVAQAFPCAPG